MIAQLLDLALKVGAAAFVLAGLVLLFAKAPRASVTLVLILTVLEGSREWPVAMGASTGALNLGWADVATGLMAAVAAGRGAQRAMENPAKAGLYGLAGMLLVGLLAWGVAVGVLPSLRYWWIWTFALATAFYAASFSELRRPDGLRPFLWAALLGSAMQAVGIVRRGFGSNTDLVLVNGNWQSARAVQSTVALIMVIGMVVVLLDGRKLTLAKLGLAAWLGVSVVLAQHRSVWVTAAVAGVLVAHALVGRSRHRLFTGTVAAFGVVLALVAMSAVVRSQQQLSASATYAGSWEWRLQNWSEKLSIDRTPLQWLVGSAFGPTPLSDKQSLEIQYSSHNMYVESLSVLGFVGLVLLVLVIVGALHSSGAGTPQRIVIVGLVVFGLFYQWPSVTWVAVGIAASACAPDPARKVRDPSVPGRQPRPSVVKA